MIHIADQLVGLYTSPLRFLLVKKTSQAQPQRKNYWKFALQSSLAFALATWWLELSIRDTIQLSLSNSFTNCWPPLSSLQTLVPFKHWCHSSSEGTTIQTLRIENIWGSSSYTHLPGPPLSLPNKMLRVQRPYNKRNEQSIQPNTNIAPANSLQTMFALALALLMFALATFWVPKIKEEGHRHPGFGRWQWKKGQDLDEGEDKKPQIHLVSGPDANCFTSL